MATDRDKILVIEVFPLNTSGVEQEAIFLASSPWMTAASDSPGGKPAVALIDAASFAWEGRCYEFTPEGLFLPGGQTRYTTASVSVQNAIRKEDGVAPLDVLDGLVFADARVNVYLSDADTTGEPTLEISLANLDPWFSGRIGEFDIEADSGSRSTLVIGPPSTQDTEAVWFAYRGFGSASRPTSASRADHSALRDDTTSHTWKVIGRWPAAAAGTWLSSPLFRMRDNAGTNVILAQYLNAAGGWTTSGSGVTVSTSGYYVFHAVYDVSDDSFTLYVDGVLDSSTTVTGGLKVGAASAATTWNNIGGSTWACAGAQHYAAALTADEVAVDARRGVEDDSRATMTIKFDESTGSLAVDSGTGATDVIITGATWPSTGEGLPSMAETRPAALIGVPLGVQVQMVNIKNGLGTAGYAGERVAVLHLAEQGLRRHPTQTIASASSTLDATKQTITPIPRANGVEFAQGSQIVMGTASGLGNPATYTISKVLGRAIANTKATIVTSGVVATETLATTFADNSDGDWVPAPTGMIIIRAGSNVALPAVVLSTAPTEHLQVSLAVSSGDSAISAIDHTLQKFGPRVSSPTIAREASGAALSEHGWMTPGDSNFSELAHIIARSSRAANGNGPLGVYYGTTGAVKVRGMWLDMQASDDFAIPEDATLSIVELRESRNPRPGRVVVKFQKVWHVLTAQASGTDDNLEAELHRGGREAAVGSGRTATVESSLALYGQAKAHADALLRLQSFHAYLARFRGELTAALIRSATDGPFLQTSISWPDRATWTTAKTGVTVGFQARPFARPGDAQLTLVFATEE